MMDNLRDSLSKWFSKKELGTMRNINNVCLLCKKQCGSMAKLNECVNHSIICLNCIDDWYDTNLNTSCLFECPCCQQQIKDFEIVDKLN